jgi:hypothetical protein
MNTPKLKKAETLKEIRKVCRPMPLEADELEAFFIETDSARDPNQQTRESIKESLESIPNAQILFYGHGGCGKSTELIKLSTEIENNFFIVSFSVQEEMNPIAIRAEDLILIIAGKILDTAQNAGLKIEEKLLDSVLNYFTKTVSTEKECLDAGVGAKAGLSSGSILEKLLGIFVNLNGEIKYNAYGEQTTTAFLRKRPSDLLVQANILIEAVKDALPENKELLVIVEGLDKIDLKQAREIYVRNARLLTGIKVSIIYTIPIFLFHSPDVGAFKPSFNTTLSLPMIKVYEPPNKRASGFEVVKSIILKRMEENLIEPDALDLLIEKTGGVLRHVFEVLHKTSLMTTAAIPLRREHIEYGLNQLRGDLALQITLPYESFPGSPQTVTELHDRLTEYARKQKKGELPDLMADPINQILIKSCALVEYNGKRWLGVHPMVQEYLEALGRL